MNARRQRRQVADMAHIVTDKGLFIGLVAKKPVEKIEPVKPEPAKPIKPKSKKK